MTIIGTSHFVSFRTACDYYAEYEPGESRKAIRATVQRKIDNGEIHIGRPTLKPGQSCYVNQDEGRYFIQEGQ